MKNIKLTGWYRGDQKPVRAGVYQTWHGAYAVAWYSYWNGRAWFGSFNSVSICTNYSFLYAPLSDQSIPWRGVAK